MSVADLLVVNRPTTATRSEKLPESAERSRAVLAGTGAALAVIGWLDWSLLWMPLGFGSVEWEFGTISRSFDALPLATIGTAAFMAVALAGRWRGALIAAGVIALALAVWFCLILGVFVLDIPVLLKDATADVRTVLLKAVTKTSLNGVLYTITYTWLGLTCLRATRRTPQGN